MAASLASVVGGVVLAGDFFQAPASTRVGQGLLQEDAGVRATRTGVLCSQANKFWVECHMKRYVPALEDNVLGVIIGKHEGHFRVDIGCNEAAILGTISFDGATKRNRPNLDVRSLVFGRVCLANRDMGPEITCCSQTKQKDWQTGESLYGELREGTVIDVTLGMARRLMEPYCPVLEALGRMTPFEIAVGHNGKVWINATKTATIVAIRNALLNSEFLPEKDIPEMVRRVFERAGL